MIHDVSLLPLPLRLRTDLCVVGAGAGGSTAATIAAEAGLDVVLLEAGELLTPGDMTQREEEMLPQLYWDAGGRSTADLGVRVHQGRGVGGSTLHNLNLCKRIPDEILARWHADRRLERLSPASWAQLYTEVEAMLEVTTVPRERMNRANRLLEAGCSALGWAGGMLQHNRTGCLGSGFCELGCAYDAKNNAAKVLVPRAVAAGVRILTRCQAVHIEVARGRARRVVAVALYAADGSPSTEIVVDAEHICLAGSATGTAALLLRSGIGDPAGETGTHLHLHPSVVAAGDFDEPVLAWKGIPQAFECTEHLAFDDDDHDGRHRAWIVPAFAHPVGTATMMPGRGAAHREVMLRYPHLAAFAAMIHDRTRGRVEPDGALGLRLDYAPDDADRRELAHGLWACARLLFAAGARRVVVPTRPVRVYHRAADADELASLDLRPGSIDLTAVHPMGSVPMGDDPKVAAVDSAGKHHHVAGLWIADGSLFPSSVGVPPQLSIYAMGLHVGRAIVAAR